MPFLCVHAKPHHLTNSKVSICSSSNSNFVSSTKISRFQIGVENRNISNMKNFMRQGKNSDEIPANYSKKKKKKRAKTHTINRIETLFIDKGGG